MKNILLSILLLLTTELFAREDTEIRVKIEGNRYEKLLLKAHSICRNIFIISAEPDVNNEYLFNIPDSIYEQCGRFSFVIPTGRKDMVHDITLCTISGTDTMYVGDHGFEGSMVLNLKFIRTEQYGKINKVQDFSSDIYEIPYFIDEFKVGYLFHRVLLTYTKSLFKNI